MGIFRRFNSYGIDYYYQGRRIREMIGPIKRHAEHALNITKAEILQGRYQIKKHRNVRFHAFAKVYLDYAKTDKRSWERDEISLKSLLPFFGSRLLSDITPFLIESYKKKRLEEVKPATVNREIGLLKHMFNMAIMWDKATTNPMRHVRLLPVENNQERNLNQEEVTKLLGACTEYSRPIVQTALHTGMRMGEILGLKWEQVDLRQRMIVILHSKNGKVRKIPINDTLLQILTKLKYNKTSEYVFVCVRTGEPAQKFRTAWLNALRRSGIPHCRAHDLRHTAASHMVAAGIDLVTVMQILGHANLRTTQRYLHSAPESMRKAVATLDARFAPQDAESGHFSDTQQESKILRVPATC